MKPIYTIVTSGFDCDGLQSNYNYFELYYSKRVAENKAYKLSLHSDGLIYSVITTDKLKYYTETLDFLEYQPLY